MPNVKAALDAVNHSISQAAQAVGRDPGEVQLIAVSKTFDTDHIRPALEAGHRHFGENRVQEAQAKWPELREEFGNVTLHLIGPLQSNKAADAVALFDVIHSVDRPKLARKLKEEMEKQGRAPDCLIQVNTGEEPQKSGIAPRDVAGFIHQCTDEIGLPVSGLMAIPPADEAPAPHFALLNKLVDESHLQHVSMGMSHDFEQAVRLGATYVRVGTAIFGSRATPMK